MPRCELTLVSKRADLDIGRILGKRVTVSLTVPKAKPRVFGGYVAGFRQTGMRGRLYVYEAAVRPWLWLLTRRSNCRIFQNKTVEEIVKSIFADPIYQGLEFGEIKWKANARSHPPREYCVQYRESDFNFVSRLLEDEGIYYWFEDKDGMESLILTDTPASHERCWLRVLALWRGDGRRAGYRIRERMARASCNRDAQVAPHRLRLQEPFTSVAKAGDERHTGLRCLRQAGELRLSGRLRRCRTRRQPHEVARGRMAR